MVDSGCAYFSPVSFPGVVHVGVRVAKLGNSSVRYELALYRNDDELPAAAGHFVHVHVDRGSNRSVPIPAAARIVLESIAENRESRVAGLWLEPARENGGLNILLERSTMSASTDIVKEIYAAFGRADVPAILELVGDEVDWEFVGPESLPYAGRRSNRTEVAAFFAAIPQADEIHVFEPREFIDAGEHVTVLGWEQSKALETGQEFSSEWVHVFTVQNSKVTRWRGFLNTAARYKV